MTREELCQKLGLPSDIAAGEVVRAHAARLAEISARLQGEGVARPVKIQLSRERDELGAAAELIAELGQLERVEAKLKEIDDELSKPNLNRGIIKFCVQELK